MGSDEHGPLLHRVQCPARRAFGDVDGYNHGEAPLDNNRCETAIRPFVVGRKGWLFSDTVKGAIASANLFSLVETAKANGLEDFEALLPWNANRPA